MKTENLQTEVYMTTEHRQNRKAKVSFASTFNKVLVSTLILTSVASGLAVPTTAYANTTVDTTSNISINYDSSVESAVYNLQQTLTFIQGMLDSGLVDTDMLTNLASEVLTLTDAVNTSGKSASNEVIDIIAEVETTIGKLKPTSNNKDGINRVNAAVVSFKNFVDTGNLEVTIEKASTDTYAAKATTTKATYPTKFTDIKSGSTYYTAVTYLAKKGAIGGYKDSTYKASTKMTNAKFLCILARTIDSKAPRAVKGNDYDLKTMNYAAKLGLFKASELKAENYHKALSKQDMALWASRALEIVEGKDIAHITNVTSLISDYSTISSKYQDAVKDMYSEGIITSTKFSPKSGVSRGTVATVIARVSNAKYRKDMSKVDIKKPSEQADDGTFKGTVVKYNDANRGLVHDGMVWQTKSGSKIKVKSLFIGEGGWTVEIPGYGQGKEFGGKVDFYTGMSRGSAGSLKEGLDGVIWNGDDTYNNQKLYAAKSQKDGATYVFFSEQWKALKTMESMDTWGIKNPSNGQKSGLFMVFYKEFNDWVWTGPNI
jgi:hypothetical protein|nr:S-layer homology domain-containing protein [uncultured Lachnoclostridium sp.]